MRSLPFLVSEAFVNLRRHGLMTIAAITTIAVALALMGSFALTFYQVTTATRRAAGDFEMRVFCREEVKKSQLPGIQARLEHIAGVRKVGYVSKEHAFKVWTEQEPIDTTGIPNKFNETFVVKMSDPKRGPAIASEIRGWHDVVQEVAAPEDEMNSVLKIAGFLRLIGLGGGGALLLGALVVVSNTIRLSLFARRREIKIMQIVGASGWFIRFPLFLEGLIHGVLGGLLAGVCLFLTAHYVNDTVVQMMPMMARYFDIALDMRLVGAALVATGALIGASGSFLSLGRYLKAV